ncbi:glycoside hydrolase TIM-barrel-like domain-containing protein [Cereibacter sphaeroides]|uniref:baseplate multidomain protein megatron n=1 Tax=Cereibacter sphaeroides TaxID=1063 RepID=UPI001F447BFD|nr:glycoside hydrolase TIM-barrel-like domain-containing protein [Cereibacter sphaeroides]MCE6961547.1 glycoside hydrolase TIM-barrel-like domain-containing protein [Cereibacter sphaeroides]MCE6967862.1 glycoside hydrolase TIM-barrel-like domain-containing protein [Cereibacter sphaeroides]MCE6972550.1 glycoside hydrolase TIM-barrel-like domain-containing protein [Cereibacter sphaeroides]
MATLLLAAAGSAIGAGFGGTVLGLTGAVIGRAIGATVGQMIDQRLLGTGSQTVRTGRIERFRLMGAGEGAAVAQVFGRNRVAGQVIWASRFLESQSESSSGGKGGGPKTTVVSYSYSVSLAVALCEGEILRVGRIWADGAEISPASLNFRVYRGTEDQLADPKIEAVEGAGRAPAYRGIAYVVIEDLELEPYGNRVPQFSFEVMRAAQGALAGRITNLQRAVRGVAMIPGSGEYSLASSRVSYSYGPGEGSLANVHSPSGESDLLTSLDQLTGELPACRSVSLVVSWFGSDLRCGACEIRPKVEQGEFDGAKMPWRVSGLAREDAGVIGRIDDRPVYGGTPADASVVEAIAALHAAGQSVLYYPFILMEQLPGNGLTDPWTGAQDQPVLPWRGRITLSSAPGCPGSPDGTTAAGDQVAAFFGTAEPGHFRLEDGKVVYDGPQDWRYRRFILHAAWLCRLAGGVEAFCIGSEMRGLTQIRNAAGGFPAVAALRRLAADVRGILGPGVKIGYAADWSEWFGHHFGGDVYFHLDPLWADENIDFIGIDNYMPLSDWRDGEEHADAAWGAPNNLDYLKANIAGGEGFDWYYGSEAGAEAQQRLPITDGAHGEPWVFRCKDLKSWWSQPHHERLGGVRQAQPTAWLPRSKPIWFTEYGCPALDNGTNQPNLFLDPKSSESSLPRGSSGRRDDAIAMDYLRAMAEFWDDAANNPVSPLYGGTMVDMSRAHVWAWDARPFPAFPALSDVWSDGDNYAHGHWLNGRAASQPLAAVVAEICERSGVRAIDVAGLHGVVRGYGLAEVDSARAALQPLMLAYGFEALERDGTLVFRMRDGRAAAELHREGLVQSDELDGPVEVVRAAEAETAGRVRLGYLEAEGDYAARQVEAAFPDEATFSVSQSEVPLVLTGGEARGTVERWLAESRVARDTARFALPRSALSLGTGDVVLLEGRRYRIDRLEQAEAQLAEAVRVEPGVYRPSDVTEERPPARRIAMPAPVYPVFLDLPLLSGNEVPHAPHVAVAASPWPGRVAVWKANEDAGYRLNRLVSAGATLGVTQTPLPAAPAGRWDMGAPLRVKLQGPPLSSASDAAVLNGANVMAIGDGSPDGWELFQFARATLVSPRLWEISRRLRGQAGTDALMPLEWPAGSLVVLVNAALPQVDMPLADRGLARHFRIGVASRGYDDGDVIHRVEAFPAAGLRPYAPVHLRAVVDGGDLRISWIRRTRIDGDSWEGREVPLGEAAELYSVRVVSGGVVVRRVEVSQPAWTYTATARAADGVAGAYAIEVAQVSDSYGPGPYRRLLVSG